MSEPTFFQSETTFRKWLEKNHNRETELLVRFHRVNSGQGGLTYRQALDQALCFGWIDGLRKRYDAGSYTVRFSPRIAGSIWSLINTKRMEELIKLDCVHDSGLAVFEKRHKKKSRNYSYEVGRCRLARSFENQFRATPTAWEFYQAQAPWYRRVSCYWVMSAKKEETRLRRLAQLITDSANRHRIKQLISNPKRPE